jgi:hypothetical protein
MRARSSSGEPRQGDTGSDPVASTKGKKVTAMSFWSSAWLLLTAAFILLAGLGALISVFPPGILVLIATCLLLGAIGLGTWIEDKNAA